MVSSMRHPSFLRAHAPGRSFLRSRAQGRASTYASFLALALSLLCGLASSRVEAQRTLDDERAKAHFFAGESYFAAERWSDAAREFALAYELSLRPEMLINLSRAHERDRHLAEAIADLELLIGRHPDNPYRSEAESRIGAMRAELAKGPVPTAEPAGTSQAPLAQAKPGSGLPAVALDEQPETPRHARVWAPSFITLAAGGAALVVGVVALGTGLRAHHLYKQLDSRCPAGACEEGFESTRGKGQALSRTSTALTFASLALAGTAAVLWVYDVKRERRKAVSLGIEGAGVRLHARF